MRHAVLLSVCAVLCLSCTGSRQSSVVPVPAPLADFSGNWSVQLALVQDECGACVPGNSYQPEVLKIEQVQDSVKATLTGIYLSAVGLGAVSGSTMRIDLAHELYESDWYFVRSSGEIDGSLSGDTMSGALFVTLGELGQCCALCCLKTQCVCGPKECRVNLPDCRISFTFTATRIPS